MRLTLDISPCPNDTFMFDALVNGRIDTRGFTFEVRFADIEALNRRVMAGSGSGGADISKISYAVLPLIRDRYSVLDSGSALGHGNGPLLVARPEAVPSILQAMHLPSDAPDSGLRIAVPGFHTTANLLVQRLCPRLTNRHSILFSQVAHTVAAGNFDAGVLIHEGRFTYRDRGLELAADLGVEWESVTGLPLPLGAIVASRSLPPETTRTIEELIRESIRFAFDHPEASRDFVRSHAREMDAAVIDSHIKLFVNDYSLSLGPQGRRAVKELTGISI